MPPKVKHQVFPEDPRDLVCLTCRIRSPWMDSPESTVERARAAGWHVFAGESVAGTVLVRVYCEACFKSGGAPRPKATAVLEGQLDLLEGFGGLREGKGPVPGRSRAGKNRRELA